MATNDELGLALPPAQAMVFAAGLADSELGLALHASPSYPAPLADARPANNRLHLTRPERGAVRSIGIAKGIAAPRSIGRAGETG